MAEKSFIEKGPVKEQEPAPKDISNEFLNMSSMEFLDFLRTQRKEHSLSITIDWSDELSEITMIRLKAFLEDPDRFKWNQKRSVTVRASQDQKNGPILSRSNCRNAFASGVRWEKIEEMENKK